MRALGAARFRSGGFLSCYHSPLNLITRCLKECCHAAGVVSSAARFGLAGSDTCASRSATAIHYGHGPIRKDELEHSSKRSSSGGAMSCVVKLADLPAEGKVPEFRVPYCGHDYPDRAGGTINCALQVRSGVSSRPAAGRRIRADGCQRASQRATSDEYRSAVCLAACACVRGSARADVVWPLQRLDGRGHSPRRAAKERRPQRRRRSRRPTSKGCWPKSTCTPIPSFSAASIRRSIRASCT